jgi:hypothetical protein
MHQQSGTINSLAPPSIVFVLVVPGSPMMPVRVVRVVFIVEINEVIVEIVIEVVFFIVVVQVVLVVLQIVVVVFVFQIVFQIVFQVVIFVEIVFHDLIFRIVAPRRTRCRVTIFVRVPHSRVARISFRKSIQRRLERVQHKISVLRG